MTRWGRSVAPKVRLVAIVLTSMAGLLALPGSSPAAADPFGWEPGSPGVPGGPGLLADSLDHWFCTPAITESNRTHYVAAMAQLDDATVMHDVNSGDTCGSLDDVAFIETDLNNLRGRAQCVAPVAPGSLRCESAWAMLDYQEHWATAAFCGSSTAEFTGNYMLAVRHELGHTVGLAHRAPHDSDYCTPPFNGDDPMSSDWIRNAPLSMFSYNTHHRAHINEFYG
jgi:hypothetical protein